MNQMLYYKELEFAFLWLYWRFLKGATFLWLDSKKLILLFVCPSSDSSYVDNYNHKMFI